MFVYSCLLSNKRMRMNCDKAHLHTLNNNNFLKQCGNNQFDFDFPLLLVWEISHKIL